MSTQPKVIQIGFNRCGSRTIYHYFLKNNLPAMHWMEGVVGKKMKINLAMGLPPFQGFDEYILYSDLMGPVNKPIFEGHLYFRDIYESYPDSLFILNTRNIESWLKSRQKYANFIVRYQRFYDLKTDQEVEEFWRAQWHLQHERVQAFFRDRPGQLLTLDIDTQGGDQLADFLKPHYDTDPQHWGHVGK